MTSFQRCTPSISTTTPGNTTKPDTFTKEDLLNVPLTIVFYFYGLHIMLCMFQEFSTLMTILVLLVNFSIQIFFVQEGHEITSSIFCSKNSNNLFSIMRTHSKNDKLQRTFYISTYLLLVRPIIVFQKLHISLFILLRDRCGCR